MPLTVHCAIFDAWDLRCGTERKRNICLLKHFYLFYKRLIKYCNLLLSSSERLYLCFWWALPLSVLYFELSVKFKCQTICHLYQHQCPCQNSKNGSIKCILSILVMRQSCDNVYDQEFYPFPPKAFTQVILSGWPNLTFKKFESILTSFPQINTTFCKCYHWEVKEMHWH